MRLLPILLILYLTACDGNTKARKSLRGEHFVPDPNYLFFKNTRQRDYRVTDLGEAGNLFEHEDLAILTSPIRIIIHDDWLDDRAYLKLQTATPANPEASYYLNADPLPLNERLDVTTIKGIYRQLSANRSIQRIQNADTIRLFPGPAADQAREVLSDYLRLVEAL